MKKLTLEADFIFSSTRLLEFPQLGMCVEVRGLSTADWQHIQSNVIAGRDENDPNVNRETEIAIASKGIVDAGVAVFDSEAGRTKLATIPGGAVKKIANAIMGLDGLDMRISNEKKS